MTGKKIFRLLLHWLATAGAVWFAAWLLPGINLPEQGAFQWALLSSLVLGLLNAIVRPILQLLSLPFILITFGLFMLVINAIMLYFVAEIVPGFTVDGFWSAVLGSLIISIVSSMFSNTKVSVQTSRRRDIDQQ